MMISATAMTDLARQASAGQEAHRQKTSLAVAALATFSTPSLVAQARLVVVVTVEAVPQGHHEAKIWRSSSISNLSKLSLARKSRSTSVCPSGAMTVEAPVPVKALSL
jgi:hypothetical protein